MTQPPAARTRPPDEHPPLMLFPLLALVAGIWSLYVFSLLPVPARVTVQSNPPGATIFLNGRLCGATPFRTAALQPGHYSLRLEKNGYMPVLKALHVPPGGAALLETLPPLGTGTLAVDVAPAGAEVLLDGEFLGHTPLRRTGIPAGSHELTIRKASFKTFVQQMSLREGGTAEFKKFALEDTVRAMLQRAIETEKYRIAHYMDLGHYLFVNDEMEAAAQMYAQALDVAGKPPEYPAGMDPGDMHRHNATLRPTDITRLNDEIKKKSAWPGKDVAGFRRILERKKEELANSQVTEWVWVHSQGEVYSNEGKLDRAEDLYQRFLKVSKPCPQIPQGYIALISVRLRLRNLPGAKETCAQFMELCGKEPSLLRQAGNEVYRQQGSFNGEARLEVLALSEQLFRAAIVLCQGRSAQLPLQALCKFELGNVLCFQNKPAEAEPFYRQALAETPDETSREDRTSRFVTECLLKQGKTRDAREFLRQLSRSTRPEIAAQARSALAALNASDPKP